MDGRHFDRADKRHHVDAVHVTRQHLHNLCRVPVLVFSAFDEHLGDRDRTEAGDIHFDRIARAERTSASVVLRHRAGNSCMRSSWWYAEYSSGRVYLWPPTEAVHAIATAACELMREWAEPCCQPALGTQP